MTTFMLAAGVLFVVSIAFVLLPLWRGMTAAGSRREANIAVYEQHVAEVDRQLGLGQISAPEAALQRDDLGARLIDDVDEAPRDGDYSSRRPWLATAVVVAGFIVVAAGLYGWLGDTRGLTPQKNPDIPALVAKMQARLSAVPNDHRTRALLGQVQMAQRNYPAAAQTFQKLNAGLDKPDPVFLLAEARARVLAADGTVNARAQNLYQEVLHLKPDNIEALWFAGLAALADGKPEKAAAYWQHLLAQADVPEDFRTQVSRRLAEVQGDKPVLEGGN